ncbi:MAG: diadenylate cyclase [Candidatus Dormibacteraceae bacterium]
MPGDTIDQFMWGYQRHFRMGVQHAAEAILKALGCPGEAEVYLVGLANSDAARHQICVEPEDGAFRLDQFAAVATRAEIIYQENPESEMSYSARHMHDRIHARLLDDAHGTAIAEVLGERHPTGGVRLFVTNSAVVGDYRVYVAIGLPEAVIDGIPRLIATVKDRVPITGSLLDGAIDQLRMATTQALSQPDPGSNLYAVDRTAAELIRSAARNLVRSAMVLAGNEMGDSPFEALTEISTLPYEKRVGFGRIIMAQPDTAGVSTRVSLTQRVRLAQHRSIRKLLELTGKGGLSLLIDGVDAYGLGEFSGERISPETTFEIRILGFGAWELVCDERPLMSVRHGTPALPRPRIDRARFEDLAERVLTPSGGSNPRRLWDLAQAAAAAEHGTMLVVTPAARLEAERLRAQATLIEPTNLPADLLGDLTAIDGAILLESDGTAVAIGVILDGTAAEAGDPSRGARFNSALRSLSSTPHPTLIILVSEDGMINLLPDLRPRVSRKGIEQNLVELRTVTAKDDFDPERFYLAYRRLEGWAFYLSAEQCTEINALRTEMEDRRFQENYMRLGMPDFKPHPEMNDSYFLD